MELNFSSEGQGLETDLPLPSNFISYAALTQLPETTLPLRSVQPRLTLEQMMERQYQKLQDFSERSSNLTQSAQTLRYFQGFKAYEGVNKSLLEFLSATPKHIFYAAFDYGARDANTEDYARTPEAQEKGRYLSDLMKQAKNGLTSLTDMTATEGHSMQGWFNGEDSAQALALLQNLSDYAMERGSLFKDCPVSAQPSKHPSP